MSIQSTQYRLTSRLSEYYSTAQPPNAASSNDPLFSSVVLLMHMDGSNGSTSFIDVKGKTVTANGAAQISTAQSRFGGASYLGNGSNSYLSIPDQVDLRMGTSNFCQEGWFYRTASGVRHGILGKIRTSDGANACEIFVENTNRLRGFVVTTGGAPNFVDLISTTTIAINTWYHFALCRQGVLYGLFLNGILEAMGTMPGAAVIDHGTPFAIGGLGAGGSFFAPFNGHIDDIRITKGSSRYLIFGTPTAAFPDS